MPTIEQGCAILSAAEAMIEAARKAYPNAADTMIKVACDNAIAITIGTNPPNATSNRDEDPKTP